MNLTGLSSTTVSSLVNELINEGVLEEIGEGVSRGEENQFFHGLILTLFSSRDRDKAILLLLL